MTHFRRTNGRYVRDRERKNAKRNPTTCCQNDRGHQIRTIKNHENLLFTKNML